MTSRAIGLSVALFAATTTITAATLQPKTIQGFKRYVSAVEARLAHELTPSGPFLTISRGSPQQQLADRQALFRGEVLVSRAPQATDAAAGEIAIEGGQVNHWRATVFVPRVTLEAFLANLMEPGIDKHKQEEVLRSVVLSRDGDFQKVRMRVKRSKVITVYYDTDYDVHYTRLSPTRACSTSLSTRIVEIENPGTPQEKELPEGDDHGFIWRMNTYWRFEATDGGVMVEVESLTLSREMPFLLKPIAGPIITHIAKETLASTLESVRGRFTLKR